MLYLRIYNDGVGSIVIPVTVLIGFSVGFIVRVFISENFLALSLSRTVILLVIDSTYAKLESLNKLNIVLVVIFARDIINV